MLCPICHTYNPPDADSCRACGAPLEQESRKPKGDALPPGTKLQGGRYTVGKVLGQGGFGITYLGGIAGQSQVVAIKEFFPYGSVRQGKNVRPPTAMTPEDYLEAKRKFLDEARILSGFRHPGIVRVYGLFEENNTAYMVMEYLKGKTLGKIIEERRTIPEREALSYIRQVGQALAVVHRAGILHRDIKPDNIIVTDSGRVVLLDFGSARGFAAGKTRRMTALLTPGYAPLEQYAERAQRGPYTDIYALAATFYHMVTGEMPVQATDRAAGVQLRPPREVNPQISKKVSDAIMWAMEIRVDDRPQTVAQFLQALRQIWPAQAQRQRPQPQPSQWREPQPRRQPRRQPQQRPQTQPPVPDYLPWPLGNRSMLYDYCASSFVSAVTGAVLGGVYLGSFGIIPGVMLGLVLGLILGRTAVYLIITGLTGAFGFYISGPIAERIGYTSQYTPLIGIVSGIILGVIISLILDSRWKK